MSSDNFFNFPVELMRVAPDMKRFCNNVMDYAVYAHSLKLEGQDAMKDAAKYFGITLGNILQSKRNGSDLYNKIALPAPMTGISKDLIFKFYRDYKTEHETAVLIAFLAIKSILGKKSYCRITNEYLLCRMAGYRSKKDMPELPAWLKRYQGRRGMNAIKLDLQRFYGLKLYARFTRGFFVSFSLSLEELIREVEKKRKQYYETTLQGETSAAVSKVLNQLYNGKN